MPGTSRQTKSAATPNDLQPTDLGQMLMAVINQGEAAGLLHIETVDLYDQGERLAGLIIHGYCWQQDPAGLRVLVPSGGNGGRGDA